MKKNIYILLFMSILILGACSKNEENSQLEAETGQQEKTSLVENKDLTSNLLQEDGVLDGKVYEQDGEVFATFEVDEKVSDENARKIAEKYVATLEKQYNNKNINVTANKNGKEISSISNIKKANAVIESVSVGTLINEGVLTLKPNPLTQQISVVLDSTKFTGNMKGKKAQEIQLTVENETLVFKENQFKNEIYNVNNTDFTEEQLKNAFIEIK